MLRKFKSSQGREARGSLERKPWKDGFLLFSKPRGWGDLTPHHHRCCGERCPVGTQRLPHRIAPSPGGPGCLRRCTGAAGCSWPPVDQTHPAGEGEGARGTLVPGSHLPRPGGPALLVIYSTAQLLNAPRAPSHPAPSLHPGQDGKLISQGSGTHPARCLA